MPIFKATDLTDAKAITFSAKDLSDAAPTNSLEDMTRTSTPSPAQAARARLAARGITPEQVKLNPSSGVASGPVDRGGQGPFDNSSWFDSGIVHPDPKGVSNNLKSGGSFLKNVGSMLNPFAWVAPPVGELLAPTNPVTFNQHPEASDPNSPNYNPTMLNLPDRLVGSVVPHPIDLGKEAYSRGEQGKTTSDMYAIPATMAATMALPKIARGILPADIAAELARKTAGSALGTTADSFKHGSTPTDALLQEPEVIARSEGRLLNKISTAKHNELVGLEHDLDTPKHNSNLTDPMQSITPVLDDAMSRAVPTEQPKIVEFQTLVNNKISTLSGGIMKLNPSQLVQLKRWLDGFIGTYKDEPVSTYKDLAQNTYSAVRKHLDSIAPEATIRGQRIQSLISAEEAIKNKITGNVPAPHTSLGEFKNIAGTVFPSTLAKTSTAALLKSLSGGAFDKVTPSPMSLGSNNPASPTQGPPSNTTVEPLNTGPKINLLKGIPITPREGMADITRMPPPSPPSSSSPFVWEEEDPFEFITKLADTGISERAAKVADLTTSTAAVRPEIVEANKQHNGNAIKYLNEKYPLGDAAGTPPRVFKAPTKPAEVVASEEPTTTNVQTPAKPTHVQEGTQVSGIDEQGNLISGNLEKLYPVVGEDGQPTWKGTILDLRNSRTMDLPADRLFDRLSGPPKSTTPPKPRVATAPTPAAPKSKLDTLLDQFDDEIPEAEDPKQAELESKVQKAPVPKKPISEPPLDKGAAAKKAVQDWLDKKALDDMEEQLGAGKRKKSGRPPGTSGAKMSDGPDPRDIARTLLDAERRRATQDVYRKHVAALDEADHAVGERYKIDKYFDSSASPEEQAKGQEIYNGFRQYRKMLKQRHGDTIKLVRLDPADEPRLPNKTVLHWWEPGTADEKAWSQDSFLSKRPRLEQEIPIDDIVAAPDFGKGKRQEFLVVNRASKYLLDPTKKVNNK